MACRSGLSASPRRRLPGVVLPLWIRFGRPALTLAQHVGRGVEGDARQPAAKRVATEAVEVAIAAEERLLDRVGSRVAVADDTHGKREQVVLVDGHDLVERVELAGERALDQRAVTHVRRVVGRPARLTKAGLIRSSGRLPGSRSPPGRGRSPPRNQSSKRCGIAHGRPSPATCPSLAVTPAQTTDACSTFRTDELVEDGHTGPPGNRNVLRSSLSVVDSDQIATAHEQILDIEGRCCKRNTAGTHISCHAPTPNS